LAFSHSAGLSGLLILAGVATSWLSLISVVHQWRRRRCLRLPLQRRGTTFDVAAYVGGWFFELFIDILTQAQRFHETPST